MLTIIPQPAHIPRTTTPGGSSAHYIDIYLEEEEVGYSPASLFHPAPKRMITITSHQQQRMSHEL